MPNYCSNTLALRHSDKNKIERLHKACVENRLCDEVIPLPEELKNTDKWYDFCVSRWGTKWDIFDTESEIDEDGVLYVMFTTAWAPPIGVYQALLEQGFDVEAKYFEGGIGFAGTFDASGDSCYEDLSDIPDELDMEFGISESLDLDEE